MSVYRAEGAKRPSVFTRAEMEILDAIARAYEEPGRNFSASKIAKLFGIQPNVFTRARENQKKHGVSFRQRPIEADRAPFADRADNERHARLIEAEVAKWTSGMPQEVKPKDKTEVDDILKTAGDVSEKRRRLLELAQTSTNETVRIHAELAEDKLARTYAETEKGPGDPLTVTDQQDRLQRLLEAVGLESSIAACRRAFGGIIQITRLSSSEMAGNEGTE